MLKDVPWSKTATYQTDSDHEPVEFFTQALLHSVSFDLQLGYFNSAAISVLSEGFAHFIAKGGNMRMAINQVVSRQDKETIIRGLSDDPMAPYDLSDIKKLKSTLDEYGNHFFECLAYLIQKKRIQIKIIRPIGKSGIEHKKLGIFDDGQMKVAFTGSANFTIGGLINNHEDIQVSFSTSPDITIQNRIADIEEKFDALMQGWGAKVQYLDASELEEAIATEFGGTDIDELVDVENQLVEAKHNLQRQVADDSDIIFNEPHFPFESGPREYQQEAHRNWINSGKVGFFAMATGTGKTLTSLNCLLEEYKAKGTYKCIILVPTISLVEQWYQECRRFGFNSIVRVSSKYDWEDKMIKIQTSCIFDKKSTSFIIISTYASVIKPKTLSMLFDLPKSTMLIADEAHNMGSPSLLKFMSQAPFKKKIGLSATPDRQYDDLGNSTIKSFFNCADGYTYEYSMKQAIHDGFLCPYEYYPHLVTLTDGEMEEYMELSLKIAKFYNAETGEFKDDPVLEALLLKRKRIIHKAVNKLAEFKTIVHNLYEDKKSLHYTMVYVPEGNFQSDYDLSGVVSDKDLEEMEYEDEETDLPMINLYSSIVKDINEKVTVEQFTAKEADRDKILQSFSTGKTQVLVAMKCLDEGVDVPRAEFAIFCASTGNPRQFIQRRGRVLRKHDLKTKAIIHDLVIVPSISQDSTCYSMEQSMLKRELQRVYDFACLSMNITYTEELLEDTIKHYKLNLYEND